MNDLSSCFCQGVRTGAVYAAADATAKNTGQQIRYLIETPANPAGGILFRPLVSAGKAGDLWIYESPEGVAGGVVETVYNADRRSDDSSGITVRSNVTTTDDGTQLHVYWVEGNGLIGGVEDADLFILKPSTEYLVRFRANFDATVVDTTLLFALEY